MFQISVVIPVYNKQAYIAATIESVLAQTFEDYEIVVVDDGSTDDSAHVLRPYRDRVVYHRYANAGPGAARNRGVEHAQGEYVAFLDADDVWKPDKLQVQVDFHRAHPDLAWSATNYHECDEGLTVLGPAHPVLAGGWSVFDNWFDANRGQFRILTSGVVVKRDVFDRVGPFDEAIPAGQDLDMWIRIARHAPRYGYCSRPLFDYRILEGSVSVRSRAKFESNIRLIEKHIASCQQAGDTAYIRFVRAEIQKLVATTLVCGMPDLSRRLLTACPAEWRTKRFLAYRLLSSLPALVQRVVVASYVNLIPHLRRS